MQLVFFPWDDLLNAVYGTRVGQLLQLLVLTLYSLWWHALRLAGNGELATYMLISAAILSVYPATFWLLARESDVLVRYLLLLFAISLVPTAITGGMLALGTQQATAIGTGALSALVITALQFPLTMYAVVTAGGATAGSA